MVLLQVDETNIKPSQHNRRSITHGSSTFR